MPSCSCTVHVDADVAELALHRLRDVLADGEAGLRDQRERERLAVPLRGCRRRRRRPARLVEQRSARAPDRTRSVAMPSVYAHDTGWIGPCATGARPSRIVCAIELAIERVDQRAPHPHVGERRELPLVQRHVLVGVAGRPVDDDRTASPASSRCLSHGTSATTCTSPLFSWLMRVLVFAMNLNSSCWICGYSAPRQ